MAETHFCGKKIDLAYGADQKNFNVGQ